jgi:hypothetical protein
MAVILGLAIAVWIFHRKCITKHRSWHAALLALTYSPGDRPSATLKEGKLISNRNSVNKDRAPDWEVR